MEEFLARLELLLQQHHDRLAQRLQPWTAQPWSLLEPAAAEGQGRQCGLPEPLAAEAQGREWELLEPAAKVQSQERRVTFDADASEHELGMPHDLERRVTFDGDASERELGMPRDLERWTMATTDSSGGVKVRPRLPSSFSTFSKSETEKRMMYKEATASTSIPSRLSGRPERAFLSFRNELRRQVTSNGFEALMAVFIMANAIFCGVEVEYVAQTRVTNEPKIFSLLTLAFTAVFALELLLRLCAEGPDFLFGRNRGYNLLDSLVVATSLLEVSVGKKHIAGGQITHIRVVRIAKAIRVLRIVRIMRNVRSLRILIYSVLNTLRSLVWTIVLLALILFAFGLVFTQAATQHMLSPNSRDIPKLDEQFGSLLRTVFTLFAAISGGVDWNVVVSPLGDLGIVWVGLFLLYFAFTYFAVLNVVTGVFCQTAIESATHDHEMAAQAQLAAKNTYVRQLQDLFKKMSVDDAGKITLTEFEQFVEDEQVKAYFASLDLSIDEAFSLFKLLDQEQTRALDIDTFVTGCLKLRGQAKSIDIAIMMYEARWNLQKCLNNIKGLRDDLAAVRGSLTQKGGCPPKAPSVNAALLQGRAPSSEEEVRHAVI